MHAIAILSTAAAALYGSVAAMPALGNAQLEARDGVQADPTSPWVTVDDEGRPATTYTPSMTTVSGTPTAVNGAPHDLTATVYTWTSWGVITTSTGEPPNPTATSKSNQGTFSRCHNTDGEFAPFCRPSHNSTLLTDNTYYITWDPDFYNKTGVSSTNTTYDITVRLDFWNKTGSTWDKLETFDDNRVPAAWGFYPLKIDTKYLKGEKQNNLTITLLSAPKGSSDKKNSVPLPILITKPGLPVNHPTPAPKGKSLYIALPVCLGAFLLLLVGGCIWNRKTRRIELGNLMKRRRSGYSGRKTRRRMFNAKDNGIQLDSAGVPPPTHTATCPSVVDVTAMPSAAWPRAPSMTHSNTRALPVGTRMLSGMKFLDRTRRDSTGIDEDEGRLLQVK
ncbi:hypothetical protein PT974_06145 [Cladobotryum mycophilum]|uniref:Uncharacterized protein n=1 Tax=Cladobotryum mycophilum TaxID=491253 RepID=A0ABR0SKR5_9HYPO